MTQISVSQDSITTVLLDTDHIKLGEASEYYKKLVQYKKLDETIEVLSGIKEEDNWKAVILLNILKKKKEEAEEPEFNFLIQQCKRFSLSYRSNSRQLSSMKGAICYRVGVDAGAGFEQGDLDVVGTEGFLNCTGVLIATTTSEGTPCYYLAHISGERTTKKDVMAELDKILSDVQELTRRKLKWSDLVDQLTLVGPGGEFEDPSLGYKQLFKILTQEKAKPTCLFGDSVAFNLTGTGDLIILDPQGQLNEGTESEPPRVGHGVYSPTDNINDSLDASTITIEEQILAETITTVRNLFH